MAEPGETANEDGDDAGAQDDPPVGDDSSNTSSSGGETPVDGPSDGGSGDAGTGGADDDTPPVNPPPNDSPDNGDPPEIPTDVIADFLQGFMCFKTQSLLLIIQRPTIDSGSLAGLDMIINQSP